MPTVNGTDTSGETLISHATVPSAARQFAIIVSASGDGTLKVWDGRNGVERLTLSGHADWVNGCVVSAEGSMIVSASHDQTLKVWDALTGACMTTLHVDGALEVCACSRDSEVIAAAGVRGIYFLRLLR